MRRSAFAVCVVLTFPLAACQDLPTTVDHQDPVLEVGMVTPVWGGDAVRVLTRNLYLGADFTPILLFDPTGIPDEQQVPAFVATVAQVWQEVLASDFPNRAKRLAWEIATNQPDAVGLQEVSIFERFPPGSTTADLTIDFLEILLAELEARGANYTVATQILGEPINLPIDLFGTSVTFTDRDAVLVRDCDGPDGPPAPPCAVAVRDAFSGHFPPAVTVELETFGGDVVLQRGWNAVAMTVRGHDFHFVNTHLEPDEISTDAQAGQAVALLTALAGVQEPILLVGDLNADPASTASPNGYVVFAAAGFVDAVPAATPAGKRPVYTCCHDADLRNPRPALFERIDHVLMSPGFPLDQSRAWLVGENPSSARPLGLWPSDHAGVLMDLRASRGSAIAQP